MKTPDPAPEDWASLGDAARAALVLAIGNRATQRLVSDIEATAGTGDHAAPILLSVLARMVRALMDTPPAGTCPECWADGTWAFFRQTVFADAPRPGINGSGLTGNLSIGLLKQFTGALSKAGSGVVRSAEAGGAPREVIVASALAAHCIQISAGVLERAAAEGWEAGDAVQELDGLFRVAEALVRDGFARGSGIGEVMGHA